MRSHVPPWEQPVGGALATTSWSLIVAPNASPDDPLSKLCCIYWRPVYAFIAAHGYSVEDAQDLTQEFFYQVFDRRLIPAADRSRGRFRNLLLTALQNFLRDEYDRANCQKRARSGDFIPLDEWMSQKPSRLSLNIESVRNWPPDKIYDLRWAASVLEEALRQLLEECESKGRRRICDQLTPYLAGERNTVSYRDVALRVRLPESTVKRLLHQLRGRYGVLLRKEILRTLGQAAEMEDEIRYLCSALGAAA